MTKIENLFPFDAGVGINYDADAQPAEKGALKPGKTARKGEQGE